MHTSTYTWNIATKTLKRRTHSKRNSPCSRALLNEDCNRTNKSSSTSQGIEFMYNAVWICISALIIWSAIHLGVDIRLIMLELELKCFFSRVYCQKTLLFYYTLRFLSLKQTWVLHQKRFWYWSLMFNFKQQNQGNENRCRLRVMMWIVHYKEINLCTRILSLTKKSSSFQRYICKQSLLYRVVLIM